jgi:pyridoxine kinase
MNILSIQSAVVQGHVGNSAAVFLLQRLGHEAWPIDTVTLAHHPGHGRAPGRVATPAELTALLDGLAARNAFAQCDALLSGYLGDAALGAVLLDAVARLRAANGRALYCCCPVMGDTSKGFYVRPGIAEFFRDAALPRADILILNLFELAFLAGRAVESVEEVRAAARALIARGPRRVIATGIAREQEGKAWIGALLVEADGGAWLAETPFVTAPASGAGDAFAALFLGHLLRGADARLALENAVTAMHAIMAATLASGADELALIAAQEALAPPSKQLFKAREMV